MKRAAFLFDLDGTLIDTSKIEALRHHRKWKECVSRARETSVYPGILDALTRIKDAGRSIAVVTTSVSFYAEAMLRHHRLPHDTLVAYHDARPTKPAPGCYLLALSRLKVTADQAIGIGDTDADAIALKAAGIVSVGAAWNPQYQKNAGWDLTSQAPIDVLTL